MYEFFFFIYKNLPFFKKRAHIRMFFSCRLLTVISTLMAEDLQDFNTKQT